MDAGEQHYSPAQKALHWVIAAIVVLFMVPAGILIANVLGEGPLTNALFELHKSFGITVFALAVARILLRWARGAPPLVPGLPGWQRSAAYVSHYAMYILIVLVPLTGWAATSACCAPVNLFWTIPLTLPVGGGMEAAKPIFRVHETLALTLAAIVLVHAAAALHHHFVRRDATLLRMWPRQT
jgi:cytochrome b561